MFAAALIAGTFLPFLPASSEVVFLGLLAAGEGEPLLLLVAATVGNLAGAIINYFAGRYVSGLAGRRWFPASEAQMQRASTLFNRYGFWTLLLSWLPAIGDLITTIAGLLRLDFRLFFVLTAVGKFFRYFLLLVGLEWFQGWGE